MRDPNGVTHIRSTTFATSCDECVDVVAGRLSDWMASNRIAIALQLKRDPHGALDVGASMPATAEGRSWQPADLEALRAIRRDAESAVAAQRVTGGAE